MIHSIKFGSQLYSSYGSDNHAAKPKDGGLEEDTYNGPHPENQLGGELGLTEAFKNEQWNRDHPAPPSQARIDEEKYTEEIDNFRLELSTLKYQITLLEKGAVLEKKEVTELRERIRDMQSQAKSINLYGLKWMQQLSLEKISPHDPDFGSYYTIAISGSNFSIEAQKALDRLAKVAPEGFDIYQVVDGDTLGKISRKFYGDDSKYRVIFEANLNVIKDINKIYTGQILFIPELKK